jgi:hypothetical protein
MNGHQILALRQFIEIFLDKKSFSGVHIILENTTESKKILNGHFGEYANPQNKKQFSKENIEKYLATEKVFAEVSFKKPHINLLGSFYYKNIHETNEYLCSVTGRKDKENFEICLGILSYISGKTKEEIVGNTPNWVKEHFVPK